MRYLIYIITVIAIVALDAGLFATLNLGSFYPNLLLLGVIAVALSFDGYDYLFLSAFGGILFDIHYGLPIGSFAIPLIVSGVLVTMVIRKWLFSDINWQHFILIVIFATLLMYFWQGLYTNLMMLAQWSAIAIDPAQLVKKIPWSIAANLIFAYPVFILVERIAEWNQRYGRNHLKLK